jgi:hypothetical protein
MSIISQLYRAWLSQVCAGTVQTPADSRVGECAIEHPPRGAGVRCRRHLAQPEAGVSAVPNQDQGKHPHESHPNRRRAEWIIGNPVLAECGCEAGSETEFRRGTCPHAWQFETGAPPRAPHSPYRPVAAPGRPTGPLSGREG